MRDDDGSARTVVQMRGGQGEVTIVRGDIGVKPNEIWAGLEIDGKEEDTIYYRDLDGKIKVGTVGEVDRIISAMT